MTTPAAPRRAANRAHRWIRQLHLWIGAWGALAAVLYGFTGLVMNHRFGDNKWPQGDSQDLERRTLAVPEPARQSAEALSSWLREANGLDAQVIRKPPADKPGQPARWTLTGGSAAQSWSVEYAGGTEAEYKASRHSPLAAFNRLHKAVGGGLGWTLLADSFALCMLLLGMSGIWMWARGRGWKKALLSVLAASLAAMALVLGPALL